MFYPWLFLGCLPYIFWTSLGACPCCSSSASFLRHPLHVLSFISFYPILVCSPPPVFIGFFGVSLILWGLLFLQFRLWLHLFLCPWSSLFRMLRFGRLLAVFLSIFPRAVATVDCFRSSSAFFCLLQFWLSFPVSLPFLCLLCLLLFYMVLVPVLPHPVPLAALRFWHVSNCLPCCGFSFGSPSLVQVLLSLRFC